MLRILPSLYYMLYLQCSYPCLHGVTCELLEISRVSLPALHCTVVPCVHMVVHLDDRRLNGVGLPKSR